MNWNGPYVKAGCKRAMPEKRYLPFLRNVNGGKQEKLREIKEGSYLK